MDINYTLAEQLLKTMALKQDVKVSDSPLTVAGLHGAVCGYVCAVPSSAGHAEMIVEAIGQINIPQENRQVLLNFVSRLLELVNEQLLAEDYSFELLLPEDESPLPERLAALSYWCDYFSVGFSAAFANPQLPLPPLIQEVLNDFVSISRVSLEASVETDEQAEADFLELEEYVRIAALNCHRALLNEHAPTMQ